MIYKEQRMAGLFLVEAEPCTDERGVFTRRFCRQELLQIGIDFTISQYNSSYTAQPGTIRGFHYQVPPVIEMKMIKCIQGGVFDVVLDLRPESGTFLQTFTIELEGSDNLSLLIPERCGHALQTLSPHTIIDYCSSGIYSQSKEGGIRWDDPDLGIDWPLPVGRISDKDKNQPLLSTQLDQLLQSMSI